MRTTTKSALALAGVLICLQPAVAQLPVALVEEVHGKPAGVELMDYVAAGKVIRLKPGEAIVLGYLRSCWHETIRGGTVVVGTEQSDVQGGTVQRRKVMCDGGRSALTPSEADQSAGTIVRELPTKPTVTLYGVSPIFEAAGGATVVVTRIDREGDTHAVTLPATRGAGRSFVDFATAQKALVAGGTYRASIGSQRILFEIAPGATADRVPIISRLLRFPPAS
jgi:hypothetical protein